MSTVRVVLADLSPMLTSVLADLVRGPGVEIVRAGGLSLPSIARRVCEAPGATVVILPAGRAGFPDAGSRMLEARAGLRVIALGDRGRSVTLGSLTMSTVQVEDPTIGALLDAVLRGHSDPCGGDRRALRGPA